MNRVDLFTSMYEDFLLECMKEFIFYDSHSDIYTVVDIIAHLPALNHVRSLSLIDAVLPLAWHMHVPTLCLHVMAEFTYKLNRYVKKELFDLAGKDTFVEKYTYQMSVLRTNFICPPFLSFLFFFLVLDILCGFFNSHNDLINWASLYVRFSSWMADTSIYI